MATTLASRGVPARPPGTPPSYVTPPLRRPREAPAVLAAVVRRRGCRRVFGVLSLVVLLAGVGLFAFPGFTDLWQRHLQGDLAGRFGGSGTQQAYASRTFAVGQGLTRLRIAGIGLDVLVVQGTTPSALQAGAGHYVDTPLPGEPGNVAIAGHRTTYGHPFNRLDEVKAGQVVELDTPTEAFLYRVVPSFDGGPNPHAVLPTDTTVIAQPHAATLHELTLTTCTPKGSAAQRLILRAVLVGARSLVAGLPATIPTTPVPRAAPTAVTSLPAPQ